MTLTYILILGQSRRRKFEEKLLISRRNAPSSFVFYDVCSIFHGWVLLDVHFEKEQV